MTKDRVTAFTDAVLAIVMTIGAVFGGVQAIAFKPGAARGAMAAAMSERQNHKVTGLDVGDGRADLFGHADGFMANW